MTLADAKRRNTCRYPVKTGRESICTRVPESLLSSGLQPLKILCLDGGGGKGMSYPAALRAIVDHFQKPIWQIYDFVVATSAGSCFFLPCAAGVEPHDVLENALASFPVFCKGQSLCRLLCTGATQTRLASEELATAVMSGKA